ncbi:hypothetical protein [Shewanella nanhaiensis]|uniref:Uncharacterized protein n=1 Tax=Shewanella nanhaiensis TaxID=2864872 RepID=A0ABS7E7G4_9GAMM|nr:hypothetical protein [Shewanella nanhaiensis]MBW8185613.1 hypothetical protein [Shewanella nanhaiensis]
MKLENRDIAMNKQVSGEADAEEALFYSELSQSELAENDTYLQSKEPLDDEQILSKFARIKLEGTSGFFGQFVYLINMLDVAVEVTLNNVMTRYNQQPGWEKTESYTIPPKQKLHLGTSSSGKVANGANYEYSLLSAKASN